MRKVKSDFLFLIIFITHSSVNAQGVWWQKKSFVGARYCMVGFNIGNKGYIGTGANGHYTFHDFWEYDPDSNKWAQKASIPTIAREGAMSFSLGGKGYVGGGSDSVGNNLNDFWEYDPIIDKWTQKANIGNIGRFGGIGFSIGNK